MAATKNRTIGFLFTDDLSGYSRVQQNALSAALPKINGISQRTLKRRVPELLRFLREQSDSRTKNSER